MTDIEWTDEVWNPVIGPHGPRWTGQIQPVEGALDAPLHWRKPRRIFVNSMSDLFHEEVPRDFLKSVMGVTIDCPQHTFQILTKRPERMRQFVTELGGFPSNVWLGVSVENQQSADERIPLLLQTPAAVRWVSVEPLLGPVDLTMALESFHSHDPMLRRNPAPCQWIIVGGESGPGARPCHVDWIRSIKDQCQAACVPCFVKQCGSYVCDRNDAGFEGDTDTSWPMDTRFKQEGCEEMYQGTLGRVQLKDRKGGDPAEWPADLRVREWPR